MVLLIEHLLTEGCSIEDLLHLVQIQNKINTATAEEKQKMAAEAPELQATLKETYEKYQKLDAEYRIKVEGHNDKRRKLHDQMTSLD